MEEKKSEKKEISKNKENETIEIPTGKFINGARKNPWIVSTVVLAIALIAVVIISYGNGTGVKMVTGEVAAEKAVSFLNSNPALGGGITLSSVEKQENFYEAKVNYKGQEVPIYITLDGEYLLNGAPLSLNADLSQTTNTANTNTQTQQEEIPKTNKPKVELYVMSFCPYGNRAEDTMLSVYNLLKNKADFVVKYIVSDNNGAISSLHGQKEVDQDAKELCVNQIYGKDKLWKFMTYIDDNCGSDGSCWQDAAKASAVDAAGITTCVTNQGNSLLKTEAAAANAAGVSGSPTLIINGVETSAVYQYENSEAYKQAICSAFTTQPVECSQVLSSTSSTGSTTTGGSCV